MKNWIYCFLFAFGIYSMFSIIGNLINKSGITLENFVYYFLKIRDAVPIVVPIFLIVFFMFIAFKCIDNII